MNQQNRRRMWLRHFLPEDLPQGRTMIYGYNSRLQSNSIHTILDYTESFLEELKKARVSEEVPFATPPSLSSPAITYSVDTY